MHKLIILTLTFLFAINSIQAQEPYYKSFEWDNKDWGVSELTDPKTILHNHEVVDFHFEGDYFIEYFLYRQVDHINHEDEIEQNNKKYIPYSGSSEIVTAKARLIKPDKRITELDDSKILYSEDEETGRKYSFFALEGLEKGDVIDFYYVVKKNANYHGTYTNIQSEYAILDYRFDLYAPSNLVFDFEVKNDTNKVLADTVLKDQNHWSLELADIPLLKPEEDAPYGSLQKYLVYKLDENLASSTKNIVSYSAASQNIYNSIYNDIEKAELKSLGKFLKKLKIEEGAPTDTLIRAVEDYVKTNINMNEYADERFDDISVILTNKIATAYGMTKILANAYKILGVQHELVITSDRTFKYFDGDFEAYFNLDQYLLYFPETNGYLCPDLFEFRYKLVPAEFMDNQALFIKEVSLGEYRSGVGTVRNIEPLGYKTTHHNMVIKGSINNDFSSVDMHIVQSGLGFYAVYLQSFLDLLSDDVYDKLGEDYLESIMVDLEADDWQFLNNGALNLNKKPLIFECNASNKNMIDYAGNKYLFKVGDIIGPQVEMYSEDDRKLPLHSDYKREFVRQIELEIPEGYEIKNPEDLMIKSEYVKEGKQVLLFKSTYTIEGTKLLIDINEFYDQLYYTVEEYPFYRDVVNSASDFNKVTLIIDKK